MALDKIRNTSNSNLKSSKTTFVIPEDSHIATLYSVVDLGLQDSGFTRKDKEGKDTGERILQNQVILTFEFSDLLMEDGRPAVASQTYTASLSDKSKLRPVLFSLLGGDASATEYLNTEGRKLSDVLQKAIGNSALVTIAHKKRIKDGKLYANIATVSTLPKALKKTLKKLHNTIRFITDIESIEENEFKQLPLFIQDKAAKRILVTNDTNDDLPF